jgi:hypothetical protein
MYRWRVTSRESANMWPLCSRIIVTKLYLDLDQTSYNCGSVYSKNQCSPAVTAIVTVSSTPFAKCRTYRHTHPAQSIYVNESWRQPDASGASDCSIVNGKPSDPQRSPGRRISSFICLIGRYEENVCPIEYRKSGYRSKFKWG